MGQVGQYLNTKNMRPTSLSKTPDRPYARVSKRKREKVRVRNAPCLAPTSALILPWSPIYTSVNSR